MNIVSWNCKGLGDSLKAEVVKDLSRMDYPDILLLQETKIEEASLLSLSKKNWKKDAGMAMSARGSSSGLATLWTEELFSLKKSFKTQHWIFIELRHSQSNISFNIFNIYVPVNFQEKRDCWNSLANFLAAYTPSNLIVVGDLNIKLDPKEKKGGVSGRDLVHK